jgi:hypothetical protein
MEVEQLCVRELEKLSIPPVEKIRIYQEFRLDRSLLMEAFAALTIRPDSLNLEEARQLGLETTLQITRVRELSRRTNSGPGTGSSAIQISESALRSAIRAVFGHDPPSSNFRQLER